MKAGVATMPGTPARWDETGRDGTERDGSNSFSNQFRTAFKGHENFKRRFFFGRSLPVDIWHLILIDIQRRDLTLTTVTCSLLVHTDDTMASLLSGSLLFIICGCGVEWSVRGITGHSALFNHVDGETQKGTDIQSVCIYATILIFKPWRFIHTHDKTCCFPIAAAW